MIIDLSPEAREYGEQARRAFEAAGGDALLQHAEADPARRASLVADVLDGLGAWDLEPRNDSDSAEAAAALCRSAGYWGLPYPVAERLARPTDTEADGLFVIAGPAPAATLAGLGGDWITTTLDGRRDRVTGTRDPRTAFVTALELTPLDDAGADDVALALVLPCWTLLGMLDRALDLTVAHVQLRRQFGQPLAGFQGVQFQLTDAEVERSGLEMLARHALTTATGPDGVSAGGGGATTGVLFSGCGFCGPAAVVVFVALLESEPPLKTMKATPTTIAVTTATMPIARARRRQ